MSILTNQSGLLVLNGGAFEGTDGNLMPNHDTQARIELGLELAKHRSIGTVAMVGGDAVVMKAYAEDKQQNDHPFITILADDISRETIGNAHFSKLNLVEPLHWNHFEVVTADYHKPRVARIFRRVFGEHVAVHGAPTAYDVEEKATLRRNEIVLSLAARAILAGLSADQDEERQRRIMCLPAYGGPLKGRLNGRLRQVLSPR